VPSMPTITSVPSIAASWMPSRGLLRTVGVSWRAG
jgi:hypothetical protein